MKKTNLLFSLPILLFCSMFFLVSCEEEAEADKPYVGTWETKVYDNLAQQKEKMMITLTNDSFEDKVFQGATEDNISEQTAVKGDVEFVEDGKINVTITHVNIQKGSYVSKADNPTEFNTYFAGGIGVVMLEDFEATYTINGNTMQMIIPVKNPFAPGTTITDTLNLTKM